MQTKILNSRDLFLAGKTLTLPNGVIVPTDENIDNLKVGAFIKIGLSNENFPHSPSEYPWAIYQGKEFDSYKVIINNDLVVTHIHGHKDEDILFLNRDQILAIFY